MGAVWGDYNKDRYPDLFLSLRGDNKLYRNNRDGTFTDLAVLLAITEPPSSFATWFWDFDNDGDQDVYVQLGGAYPADRNVDALFENPGNDQHSVTHKLEGTKTNRCAIGTKIRLLITEDGVARSIYKDVTSGSSFGFINKLSARVTSMASMVM